MGEHMKALLHIYQFDIPVCIMKKLGLCLGHEVVDRQYRACRTFVDCSGIVYDERMGATWATFQTLMQHIELTPRNGKPIVVLAVWCCKDKARASTPPLLLPV
jgi:hypothetical protein